jgi:hypothetical protein
MLRTASGMSTRTAPMGQLLEDSAATVARVSSPEDTNCAWAAARSREPQGQCSGDFVGDTFAFDRSHICAPNRSCVNGASAQGLSRGRCGLSAGWVLCLGCYAPCCGRQCTPSSTDAALSVATPSSSTAPAPAPPQTCASVAVASAAAASLRSTLQPQHHRP